MNIILVALHVILMGALTLTFIQFLSTDGGGGELNMRLAGSCTQGAGAHLNLPGRYSITIIYNIITILEIWGNMCPSDMLQLHMVGCSI